MKDSQYKIPKKYITVEEGYSVRILTEDFKNAHYPVLIAVLEEEGTERLVTLTETFREYDSAMTTPYIREVLPYEDFKIDDPVLVRGRGSTHSKPQRRHFAGVDDNGDVKVFAEGSTSWSTSSIELWDNCRRPTKEELNHGC